MSEREPITGELRELMGGVEPRVDEGGVVTAKYVTPEAWGEFVRRCDAIDAVHAGLERENAELRERLAVLDNRSDSMHIGGATVTITDELRKYANDAVKRDDYMGGLSFDLMRIADRIDAEHKKQVTDAFTKGAIDGIDIAEHSIEYVKLPVDADGVPIRVGDVMCWLDEDSPNKVDCMHLCGDGWWVYAHGVGVRSKELRHHHAQTVEDVLREMLKKWGDAPWDSTDDDEEALVAEFAVKLRLADDEGVDTCQA